VGKKLRALSFIHAARWTIVERVPGGPRLGSPLLLFESNFNGDWATYIDAFAYVIPERMAGVWATSWGWPGAQPAGPFKAYIRRNEHVNPLTAELLDAAFARQDKGEGS